MSKTNKKETKTITLTIDEQQVTVDNNISVLEAAQLAGIYIPTLCNHPDLPSYGGCRMCLVEIENMRGFPPACTTPVQDKMVIRTNTPQLQELRRNILELLLTEHPHTCLICDRKEQCKPYHTCIRKVSVTTGCTMCAKNDICELQKVVEYIGLKEVSLPYSYRKLNVLRDSPFFDRDYNLCILCGRCVRVCQEIRGVGAIAFTYRGAKALVGTAFNYTLKKAGCQFCGACVDVCPTGALVDRATKWSGLPDSIVTTTCPYCGVGCQITLQVKNERITSSLPIIDSIPNKSQLCVKGRFGIAEFVHHPERLTTPLIKKNERFIETTWDEALDLVAENLKKYKGDQFALISSPKITNEDNYLAQKFSRVVMGSNNVDQSSRLCHAPSLAGLTQAFGTAAMTNPISDIDNANCIFVIGSNTSASHPIISLQIKNALKRGAILIVADPRRIKLCQWADIWLRNIAGSDVALLMGMMKIILNEGLLDSKFIEERCEDFDKFRESLIDFNLDFVVKVTGVPKSEIEKAARIYATKKPSIIIYGKGITQHIHGTDNVLSLANLAMLTGNIGKPFTGIYSLCTENNTQGSCDMGCLPDFLTGYQRIDSTTTQEKFENAWRVKLNPSPGLTLHEIIESAHKGNIKSILIIGENLLLSGANTAHIENTLKNLEFLVVQDIFLTETARLAHVVLPACSFAEKDGTFTNTERRISRVRKAIDPIGNSRPDWWIICELSKRMGAKGFDYKNPQDIMQEISEITPIYGGINYKRLEEISLQWPCPDKDSTGTPRLYVNTFTRGKGRFISINYRPPEEVPDKNYPFILTTGCNLYHHQTGTMTRKVLGLNALDPGEIIEINPDDAKGLNIDDGNEVIVISRRGKISSKAKLTDVCPKGMVFMEYHHDKNAVNILTNSMLDPVSKIPGFKICAVRIEKK